MISGYEVPSQTKMMLDNTLKFRKRNQANEDERNLNIDKVITDSKNANYIKCELMAMIIWDLPGYEDIMYILFFSFADTRHAIILMHNCVAFRMITEEAVFKFAQNHYNDNYDPNITDNDLK